MMLAMSADTVISLGQVAMTEEDLTRALELARRAATGLEKTESLSPEQDREKNTQDLGGGVD